MAINKKSPAKRPFCVWADLVRRVYQHVEATSPTQAQKSAEQRPDLWVPCEEHAGNGYRLSDEVQDLATGTFVRIHSGTHCRTCGSEIIETINDTCFREGECGPCEYLRYQSHPALLHACYLATEEIEQWDQVMGGSEDPRTKETLNALRAATDQACGKTDEASELDSETTDGAAS